MPHKLEDSMTPTYSQEFTKHKIDSSQKRFFKFEKKIFA